MRPADRNMQGCARSLVWTFAALLITSPVAWADVTVSLTAPANGTSYVPPVNITLSASASASQGYTVSKVEFFNGTTLIGTDTSSPYSITWTNAPSGQHVLTAKATAIKKNSPDQTATSTAVSIIVNAPPVVSFTSPPQNPVIAYIPPPPITVTATASDSDGTIAQVEFWTGCSRDGVGTLAATFTAPPYTYVWTIPPPYQDNFGKPEFCDVTAYATDNLGARSWVNASILLYPTVVLSSPPNGATYNAPASIPLGVTITPSDWSNIEKVQYFNGTTLIGESFTAPYSFTWQNVGVGTYSLSAKMVSHPEYDFVSAPISVTVTAGAAQLHFVHVDHLNTPRLVANQSGQTVWRWDQAEPFGNDPADENPSGLGNFDLPLRLPGQYFDKETNLHYNYFRDFDPSIGRYVESDPVGLRGGLNTYLYVLGGPLLWFDRKGLNTYGSGGTICPNPAQCPDPPFEPTPEGPKPGPQPPNNNPNVPGKCHPVFEWLFNGCSCAQTSTNFATCMACCKTIPGFVRSGGGTVCQQGCNDKYPKPAGVAMRPPQPPLMCGPDYDA